ncbi:MAG: transglycosylase SLT domain-containing protein [Bacteroidaceae bacterium]|nr:transglycosylase SLT domain-containing protein [Bacteroidaceae bacterium]
MKQYVFFVLIIVLSMFFSCKEQPQKDLGVFHTPNTSDGFDLDEIQANGELIILTLYGQQNYFEYYGEGYGVQYKLANEYAKSIGCTIRVDVMADESSMLERLANGDADVIACQIPYSDSLTTDYIFCGQKELTAFIDSTSPAGWLTRSDTPKLAASLNKWLKKNKDNFIALTTIRVADENGRIFTPQRHTYSPILNYSRGEISRYDHLFKKYAAQCGWDWRLLAALAYQESAFDEAAVSYMGAIGLMQLMPATANSMGISISQAFNPETNVRGAVRYIDKLNRHYSSITNADERINFILAAYNGGEGHVDDARNLTKKYGGNPNVWSGNVDKYIIHLSESQYFNDPIVRHGYMRGSETYNYVYSIRERWANYRNIKR